MDFLPTCYSLITYLLGNFVLFNFSPNLPWLNRLLVGEFSTVRIFTQFASSLIAYLLGDFALFNFLPNLPWLNRSLVGEFVLFNFSPNLPWLNRLLVGDFYYSIFHPICHGLIAYLLGDLHYSIFHPICHGLIAYLLGEFSYNMNFSPTYAIAVDISQTREYLQLSNDIFERITEYDDIDTNRSNKPDYML